MTTEKRMERITELKHKTSDAFLGGMLEYLGFMSGIYGINSFVDGGVQGCAKTLAPIAVGLMAHGIGRYVTHSSNENYHIMDDFKGDLVEKVSSE
ncbi:MAG: hypothetical protein KKG75_04415 [Nanoarchaeota archaeon]|nr:hypothetical protein [Nanoarchaeota archaeon]